MKVNLAEMKTLLWTQKSKYPKAKATIFRLRLLLVAGRGFEPLTFYLNALEPYRIQGTVDSFFLFFRV